MTTLTGLILAAVLIAALIFVLTNGLHDASSVVATFIACGAGSPKQAVMLASVFGLVGAVTGGSAVADTISSIINVPKEPELLKVLLAALIGAVAWNVVTWQIGIPSSSTHALVGGLVGAVWVSHGPNHILWGWQELTHSAHSLVGVTKIVAALIISPFLGFFTAFILQMLANLALRNAKFAINEWIKKIQWLITGLLAFSHGANDTQKSVGVMVLAIAVTGNPTVLMAPIWIKVIGGMTMFFGTLLGGWSIMKTIGRGIYTIRPIHSLNSQLSSGTSIILATVLGAPVSTTHVVVGSVMGVGGADEFRMVNWKVGQEIVIAWFVTIPAAAVVAAFIYNFFLQII